MTTYIVRTKADNNTPAGEHRISADGYRTDRYVEVVTLFVTDAASKDGVRDVASFRNWTEILRDSDTNVA